MENKSPLRIVAGCITLLGIIIILPGIVLAVVGGVWWYNVSHFVQTAEHTEGTIIELVLRQNTQSGGDMYSPVVEFTDHLGQRHEYRSNASSNPSWYSVGDKVQMLYERDRPNSASINHWFYLYFGPFMCLMFAAIDVIIAIVLLVVALFVFRYSKSRKGVAIPQEPQV